MSLLYSKFPFPTLYICANISRIFVAQNHTFMEKIVKRIYQGAGIYGLLILVPQLFLGNSIVSATPFPININYSPYFEGFMLVAIAWQVTFLLIATDPKRYRLIMLGTILEKAGFAFLCLYLKFFKDISPDIFLGGMVDLLLMFAFIFCFWKTEKE